MQKFKDQYEQQLQQMTEKRYVHFLIAACNDDKAHEQTKAIVIARLHQLRFIYNEMKNSEVSNPHRNYIGYIIDQFLKNPLEYNPSPVYSLPPGSPIGCGHEH